MISFHYCAIIIIILDTLTSPQLLLISCSSFEDGQCFLLLHQPIIFNIRPRTSSVADPPPLITFVNHSLFHMWRDHPNNHCRSYVLSPAAQPFFHKAMEEVRSHQSIKMRELQAENFSIRIPNFINKSIFYCYNSKVANFTVLYYRISFSKVSLTTYHYDLIATEDNCKTLISCIPLWFMPYNCNE